MHARFTRAALVALSAAAICSSASAEAPAFTPINSFVDAYGLWLGQVDITTKVVMTIYADGKVDFYGPNTVHQQGQIINQRLVIQSKDTDLDCGLMNERLTCHARFNWWFAELNLTKKPGT
jgi:hypothetical protein